MALVLPGLGKAATTVLPGPSFAGLGRQRKIAILGNHRTIAHAPWDDGSWELWAHTSSSFVVRRTPDRYFDLHPKVWWEAEGSWKKGYKAWLAQLQTPIFMQEKFAAVPASIRYPKERILAEFRRYFTSQTAWMIELALTEGVTHLALYGIAYEHYTEYATQRAGAEYWLGFAEGRGVQIVLPEGTPICRFPSKLYGYESHEGGVLQDEYKWSPKVTADKANKSGPLIDVTDPTVPPLRDLGEPIAEDRSKLFDAPPMAQEIGA